MPEGQKAEAAAPGTVHWIAPGLEVLFEHGATKPLSIRSVATETTSVDLSADQPLVEIITAASGHGIGNSRLGGTEIGSRLRYVAHEIDGHLDAIRFTLAASDGIKVLLTLTGRDGAFRSDVAVTNETSADLILMSVTSWASGFGRSASRFGDTIEDWMLLEGASDWLGEGRWSQKPLRPARLARLRTDLTGHAPRQSVSRTVKGTWSTSEHLPVAGVSSSRHRVAWLWQPVHNGPWRWEVGEGKNDFCFAVSGPTDRDHLWSQRLAVGETFTAVPALVAVGGDVNAAAAALTRIRRRGRREHSDNLAPLVVFNDYMNTLNGDPTTERLLPLIDAAASVGAEVFCIDAGWYSESPGWGDEIGTWEPSSWRFPGGFAEVIEAIRSRGMTPGLWLEPEVVSENSVSADRLPAEAFFQRRGVRLNEAGRYHLDLRIPEARAFLDHLVDRLVSDFGIGYFKFDYNSDIGPGTDLAAESVGAGLLAHNRAHLSWIAGILDRYPNLILENCASGGMRSDAALLSQMQLQSTSDQQDPLRYPPIAASAPLLMLPEQAANWAYPRPDMNPEEIAFTLVTGLAGRLYLSGHLDKMGDDQRQLVRDAVAFAKMVRREIVASVPSWPLGLPEWDDRWVSSALGSPERLILAVWDRGADSGFTDLDLPMYRGRDLAISETFPSALPAWGVSWDADNARLRVESIASGPSARIFLIMVL